MATFTKRFVVSKKILIVSNNKECNETLCEFLKKKGYVAISLNSVMEIGETIRSNNYQMVFLDINNIGIDNRGIRELTIEHPSAYFIGLTDKKLNPEFKESICYHMYACMHKPPDFEELLFWVKSIFKEERDGASNHLTD